MCLLNGIVTARPQETETHHDYHKQDVAQPLAAQEHPCCLVGNATSVTSDSAFLKCH